MLKSTLINSISELFTMFGLEVEYQKASELENLSSANNVNILIGFTNNLKGNVILGFDKSIGLKIASLMMGGMEINEYNDMVDSALSEAGNMIIGSALTKLNTEKCIDISPPTLIKGDKIFIMISRLKSSRLTFKIAGELYYITYCIE